jgi:hypothetical protein
MSLNNKHIKNFIVSPNLNRNPNPLGCLSGHYVLSTGNKSLKLEGDTSGDSPISRFFCSKEHSKFKLWENLMIFEWILSLVRMFHSLPKLEEVRFFENEESIYCMRQTI